MNPTSSPPGDRPLRRFAVLAAGLCLAGLPGAMHSADPGKSNYSAPATPTKVAFEDAQIDPLAAAREGIWHVAFYKPAVKKIAFDAMAVDPRAAECARLWTVDPRATQCAALWAIDVSAGCGDTCCAHFSAKKPVTH